MKRIGHWSAFIMMASEESSFGASWIAGLTAVPLKGTSGKASVKFFKAELSTSVLSLAASVMCAVQ
jgi:hypothetical protein